MTLEELAIISQREYEAIRNEMVTREELKTVEGNILHAIGALSGQLAAYASRWAGEFENMADRLRTVELRVDSLERSKN